MSAPTAGMDRATAIELGVEVVKNVADKLLAQGQASYIERDDLISAGIEQAIRTVDRNLASGNSFPLDKAIARDVRTIMLRHIAKEERESTRALPIIPAWMKATIWTGRDRFGYYYPEVDNPKFEYPEDARDFHMAADCALPGEWIMWNKSLEYAPPDPDNRDAWGYLEPQAETF